jgi:subtilisin family serine protease
MSEKKNLGNYFWRGGQRIELEKEEEFFTAVASDESDLERVRLLPGVREVKLVGNQVFKVHVAQDQRDAAMDRFRSEEIGGVCHHAYRPKGAMNTRYYLTAQIIVKFGIDVPTETIESILSEAGVQLLKEYPDLPNTYLIEVTRDAGKNPIKVANALAERDEVEYAEPNLMNRFQSFHLPTDTLFPKQWHLKARNGPQVVEDADVSATEAWEITRGRRDVVVAIIDDGVSIRLSDFSGNGKVVYPKDYVDGNEIPFPVAAHGDYHGTPCAGVAIAEENAEGVVGIAPGCALMPVRFDVSTASDDLLWVIFNYVGKRADVISCSWGPCPANAPLSQLLSDKFQELATSGGPRKRGCVIVFAAGNYNAPLNDPDNTSFSWRHPVYGMIEVQGSILNGSATHPNVIAVAASTSLNRKAAYSNWGKEISVCAPSNNFHPYTMDPLPGLGIWTTDNEKYGEGFTSGSEFTGRFGGTSSAAPLVAGVAALVISENPELSASEVKQILEETADKIEDTEPDPVLGLTKGSYDANGHSQWFGHGKVNAARAVQRARELHEGATGISNLRIEGVTADGNLAETDAVQLFRVTLGDMLGVTLQGPEGEDFDLYLKRGSVPTTEDYDARGVTGSANEKVVLQSAEPGEYYILVKSYRGAGNFKVKVEVE